MMPRPKIVHMPICVPPNMATVPKTLPAAVWLSGLLPASKRRLVDDRQRDEEPDPVDGQEHGRHQDLALESGTLNRIV